jgi:hypothetical protein
MPSIDKHFSILRIDYDRKKFCCMGHRTNNEGESFNFAKGRFKHAVKFLATAAKHHERLQKRTAI